MGLARRWVAFAGSSLLAFGPAALAEDTPENALCLDCHGDAELAPAMTLQDGAKLALFVDPEELPRSVHAKVGCVDCHADLKDATDEGHVSTKLGSKRELTIKFSEHC